jgi:hypothetical protein
MKNEIDPKFIEGRKDSKKFYVTKYGTLQEYQNTEAVKSQPTKIIQVIVPRINSYENGPYNRIDQIDKKFRSVNSNKYSNHDSFNIHKWST